MNNHFFKINGGFVLSLFSGKINISIFSFIALFLFLFADLSVYTLILLCCIVIHELSHIITLKLFGGNIKKINVYPFGIDIISDMNTLSYTKELSVVLSGGVTNLLCAITAHYFWSVQHSAEMCFFIYANVVFGIGNLLPLPVFDGGRALHIIISRFFLPDIAFIVQKWTDFFAFLLFFAFSILLMLKTQCNFTLVICIAYTALAAVIYEKLTCSTHYKLKL